MAFIRVKKIYGNRYGYLVHNSWTGLKTSQKVGKYLGKILKFEKERDEKLKNFLEIEDIRKYVRENAFKKITEDLVNLELHNHGVNKPEFSVDFDGFKVQNRKGKNVVFELNNGFLCGHTLEKLANYDSQRDYSGYLLADLITGAGILPEQEFFIELYAKFRENEQVSAARKFEFYY